MKFDYTWLEKGLVGLVIVFALITMFGIIATPIGLAIRNVTTPKVFNGSHWIAQSPLNGATIFTVAGIIIVVGVLVVILRGFMSGKR